jgi:hypothetical protein
MAFGNDRESLQQDVQKNSAAIQENTIALEENKRKASEHKEKIEQLNAEFSKTASTIKGDFSKSLIDAIKGGDSFSATFQNVRKTLEDLAIKTAIVNPISDILFGGNSANVNSIKQAGDIVPEQGKRGLFGDIINGVADLFGARAFGGPVGAGQPFLVGERGPELFVPQTAGSINPNLGSGAVNITMHINANDAASFQASQTQIAASMMDAARRAQRIR